MAAKQGVRGTHRSASCSIAKLRGKEVDCCNPGSVVKMEPFFRFDGIVDQCTLS